MNGGSSSKRIAAKASPRAGRFHRVAAKAAPAARANPIAVSIAAPFDKVAGPIPMRVTIVKAAAIQATPLGVRPRFEASASSPCPARKAMEKPAMKMHRDAGLRLRIGSFEKIQASGYRKATARATSPAIAA